MIAVQFPANTYEITAEGLKQWDKGQELKIVASSVTVPYEVHFSNKGSETALRVEVTKINDITCVAKIPDIILASERDAIAWVYTVEGETGTTVKRINLPIEKRAKPEDYIYEPDTPKVETLLMDLVIDFDYRNNVYDYFDNFAYDNAEVINAYNKVKNGEKVNVQLNCTYAFNSGEPYKVQQNVVSIAADAYNHMFVLFLLPSINEGNLYEPGYPNRPAYIFFEINGSVANYSVKVE